jgi:hypothetical protein
MPVGKVRGFGVKLPDKFTDVIFLNVHMQYNAKVEFCSQKPFQLQRASLQTRRNASITLLRVSPETQFLPSVALTVTPLYTGEILATVLACIYPHRSSECNSVYRLCEPSRLNSQAQLMFGLQLRTGHMTSSVLVLSTHQYTPSSGEACNMLAKEERSTVQLLDYVTRHLLSQALLHAHWRVIAYSRLRKRNSV